MADNRLPWHNEPKVDHQRAAERAINAARPRRVDVGSEAIKAFAQKAFDDEIDKVKKAPDGSRNDQLFKSGANLFELVAAGALGEDEVTNALMDASAPWNTDESGTTTCRNTVKSARRHGYDNPRDLSHVGKGKGHNGFHLDVEPTQTVTLTDAFTLERGFWDSRDSLRAIYLGALSRMCSPWAVLGYCAARALALVRPNAVLPPIIGGRGSLNWFCAIAARSGGGKGTSLAVARELVREHVFTRNLGSGEGLVDAYFCKEDDDNPTGRRESVMFVADEIDSMSALGSRSGSTLMGTLRSAFSGETLGFSYRSNKNHLEPHSYRMTLVVNVQPARAGSLMDDKHGGTLQRFMWFPGTDPRITSETPLMPAQLDIPSNSAWLYPRELKVPYETVELIKDQRARDNAGLEDDPSAGHALYMREKFAYALAVLDGRDTMNLEDWRLSGIASKVSDQTRAWVEFQLRAIQDDEAAERGRLQGVSRLAADDEHQHRSAQRLNTIKQRVLTKVKESDGITQRKLMQFLGRDGVHLQSALDGLVDDGLIRNEECSNKHGPKSLVWRVIEGD